MLLTTNMLHQLRTNNILSFHFIPIFERFIVLSCTFRMQRVSVPHLCQNLWPHYHGNDSLFHRFNEFVCRVLMPIFEVIHPSVDLLYFHLNRSPLSRKKRRCAQLLVIYFGSREDVFQLWIGKRSGLQRTSFHTYTATSQKEFGHCFNSESGRSPSNISNPSNNHGKGFLERDLVEPAILHIRKHAD